MLFTQPSILSSSGTFGAFAFALAQLFALALRSIVRAGSLAWYRTFPQDPGLYAVDDEVDANVNADQTNPIRQTIEDRGYTHLRRVQRHSQRHSASFSVSTCQRVNTVSLHSLPIAINSDSYIFDSSSRPHSFETRLGCQRAFAYMYGKESTSSTSTLSRASSVNGRGEERRGEERRGEELELELEFVGWHSLSHTIRIHNRMVGWMTTTFEGKEGENSFYVLVGP
ncbi:hypothetical protein SCHPADRAFT_617597 [Schizopora paradoxa]|uniref:Uncharacterized protein n=1 Tax=Schizopora paradoxa TaxID=27342 RepID=A0A0H2R8Q1_9AGAM|nr:hypothetical protein SCHPADRAFT_617597 [Schizopora paradoxa]